MAGGDVVENQLIRPVFLIFPRERHGIARVNVVEELNAFDDPAAIDIQTRDNALGEHWVLDYREEAKDAKGEMKLTQRRKGDEE
jgi:hypothetical protein